ncbi:hypothetical protein KEJ50_03865 [Candidatus Bathyarchaeota archaeon]|nr:hypothetical protein [Candidatus Bathyarchaeota archaeon]
MSSTGVFDFAAEAAKIVEEANKAGIILRIMGATAIRIHCSNNVPLHKALGRELTDIDFVAYSKQREKIENLFTQALKYDMVKAALTPGLFVNRCIFFDKEEKRPHIDVFLDKLEMNHIIEFKDRLEKDYPTIPLAELLLEKVQIVKINEKDIKDVMVLLLEHEVGEGDKEVINAEYIAKILSKDWGFYYTVTLNLNKVKAFLEKYEVITDEQRKIIEAKINKLLEVIEKEPKTLGWKLRAKVGPTKKWYNEVEEVERAEHLKKLSPK